MKATSRIKEFGGVGLLVLGVLGIVLPILPGIPFLIAGVAILGYEHPLIRPFMKRIARWREKTKTSATEESKTADSPNEESTDDQQSSSKY